MRRRREKSRNHESIKLKSVYYALLRLISSDSEFFAIGNCRHTIFHILKWISSEKPSTKLKEIKAKTRAQEFVCEASFLSHFADAVCTVRSPTSTTESKKNKYVQSHHWQGRPTTTGMERIFKNRKLMRKNSSCAITNDVHSMQQYFISIRCDLFSPFDTLQDARAVLRLTADGERARTHSHAPRERDRERRS